MINLHLRTYIRTYIHGRAEVGLDSAPVHSWRSWGSKGGGLWGPWFGVWGGTDGCVERSRSNQGRLLYRAGGWVCMCMWVVNRLIDR
jgi:hypothetical protein